MRRIILIGLAAASLFVALGCQNEPASPPANRTLSPVDSSRLIADFKIKLPLRATDVTAQCKTPKPATVGCTTVCKPCVFSVCLNGEWVRHEVDTRDLCKNPTGGGVPEEEGFACLVDTSSSFCPMDCSFCIPWKE
jgi:hypothetical protein